MVFRWYSACKRPAILEILQKLRLVSIDYKDYPIYNDMILGSFKNNVKDIIDITKSKEIPIILITPVGNLHAKPYGEVDKVNRLYDKGIRSDNYETSIYYLRKAKEEETLTGVIRAKDELLDYLRQINNTRVYVYDLEKELIEEKFGFGEEDFIDYLHFKERSHKLIASKIFEFISDNKNIRKFLDID